MSLCLTTRELVGAEVLGKARRAALPAGERTASQAKLRLELQVEHFALSGLAHAGADFRHRIHELAA